MQLKKTFDSILNFVTALGCLPWLVVSFLVLFALYFFMLAIGLILGAVGGGGSGGMGFPIGSILTLFINAVKYGGVFLLLVLATVWLYRRWFRGTP